jgi:hypothetical protein
MTVSPLPLRLVGVTLVLVSAASADLVAQSAVRSGATAIASRATSDDMPRARRVTGPWSADTTEARRPVPVLPFLLGGAIIGGTVGGVLASSYDCGEPQQYVTCAGTETSTGVIVGAGIGAVLGWLVWKAFDSNRGPLRHFDRLVVPRRVR